MEVYNLHKQLQNEGFKFYNFNSNDIPEYYAVRLNDTHKLISRKLKWRKKKKELIKVYYRRVLLQGNFPLQYSTLLDSTRSICIRPKISQISLI